MIYTRSLAAVVRDWNRKQARARAAYYRHLVAIGEAEGPPRNCPCGVELPGLRRTCDDCQRATNRANERARYHRKKAQP